MARYAGFTQRDGGLARVNPAQVLYVADTPDPNVSRIVFGQQNAMYIEVQGTLNDVEDILVAALNEGPRASDD